MRYSSALVLGAFAVGEATAYNLRHASFHARRNAESKREMTYDNPEWAKTVDWNKAVENVDWDSVFNKPAGESTPSPAPAPVAEIQAKPEKKPEPSPAPAYSSAAPPSPPKASSSAAPPASSTAPEAPKKTESSYSGGGAILAKIEDGISDLKTKMKVHMDGYVQPNSPNGVMWLGPSSQWSANFFNDGADDLKLLCWQKLPGDYSAMCLNVNTPKLAINIPVGQNQTVSFADQVSMACAPAYPDTILDPEFGGVKNTWFEATWNQDVTFDISRNPYMGGNTISAKGSKCTSNMEQCVFKCKDSSKSKCTEGTDYDLFNCNPNNGGGGGYNAQDKGTGGGCHGQSTGEHLVVTISQ